MRVVLAALLVGYASARCLSITAAAGGGATCGLGSTEQVCTAMAAAGCSWTGTACVAVDTCKTATTEASCPVGTCVWDQPGRCDLQADPLNCVAGDSGFMQCLVPGLQESSLTAAYANLSLAVDLTAHIEANIDRVLCTCLSLYFSCLANSDCGRDPVFNAGFSQACAATFTSTIASVRPGLTACSTTWCNGFGRTDGVSTFTVTFTFNASNAPSTWSAERRAAFLAVLNAELTGVPSQWISFDAALGMATVTIPSGTSLSAEQMAGIKATFLSWNNPSSSNAAPMFDAMGVQGANATAEPAPIQSASQVGAASRAGFSLLAVVAAVLALAKLV